MLGLCGRASDGPSRRRRRASWDDVDNAEAVNGDRPPKPEVSAYAGVAAGWPKDECRPKFGLGEPRVEWKELRELSRGGKKGWPGCRAGCGGSESVCGCWAGQDPKIRGKETVRRRSNVGCCQAGEGNEN